MVGIIVVVFIVCCDCYIHLFVFCCCGCYFVFYRLIFNKILILWCVGGVRCWRRWRFGKESLGTRRGVGIVRDVVTGSTPSSSTSSRSATTRSVSWTGSEDTGGKGWDKQLTYNSWVAISSQDTRKGLAYTHVCEVNNTL